MYYCVVYYPGIDTSKIEVLRQKYDPTHSFIAPHLTLVFPIPTDAINEDELHAHVKGVIEKSSQFPVHLNGFEQSWDHWLFLGVSEGKEKFVELHDKLYEGILESQLRKDLPFSPHLSLGLFTQKGAEYSLKNPEAVAFNEKKYNEALAEAKELGLDYSTTMDKVTVIKLDDNLTQILESKEIALSKIN